MPVAKSGWPGEVETIVASAARTTSGDSGSLTGYGPPKTLRAQLNVTASGGVSPTLDVVIEDTLDGGTNWNTIGTFAQKTGTGREVINVTTAFSDVLRVKWTIAATSSPTFTFSVSWAAE